MWKYVRLLPTTVVVGVGLLASVDGSAQTPEQEKVWEAQRIQSLADERARTERLTREREARRADPMAWVRTLNPMTAGGWEFRTVANDGSWAAYSTDHQMKHSGKLSTVWLRQEFAEPQTDGNGRYLSIVEKVQYDCAKQRARSLLVIYYSENNIQGSEQSEEADERTASWNAIVPGTREELNFLWACGAGKSAPKN
jgi:hypothetical protein